MNIMVVGVGGQGTLLTSRIIGKTALKQGFDVKLSEVHGMAQRGGSVVTFVRFDKKVYEPVVEEGNVDVLISFEKLEALREAVRDLMQFLKGEKNLKFDIDISDDVTDSDYVPEDTFIDIRTYREKAQKQEKAI